MKKFFVSHFQKIISNVKNSSIQLKSNSKTKTSDLKNKFNEARKKPHSKRKYALLGFSAVLGIFGITILGPVLQAIAKDIAKLPPPSGDLCPAPDYRSS